VSARGVLELLVDLGEGLDARVVVHAQGVVVELDEVAEGDGRVVLLAQLVYLAEQLVYLVGLGVVGADVVVGDGVADELLQHGAELTQLVAVVLAGDVDSVVRGDADLVNGQALVLKDLGHAAVVAVMLLDGDGVGNGHDGVEAEQIGAGHGRGQRVHEAEHVVQGGLGGLGIAALADEVGLRAGGGYPLLGNEIAEELDDLLALFFLLDDLQGARV